MEKTILSQTIRNLMICISAGSALVACGGSGSHDSGSSTQLLADGEACNAAWASGTAYNGGAKVSRNGRNYTAAYWTQGDDPAIKSGAAGSGQPWTTGYLCGSGTPTPTPTPTPAPTPTPTPAPTPTPTPAPTPTGTCTLQAEDYSSAYDDAAGNAGGAYRAGDVDIEATSDAGGGYDVGWIDSGEWLAHNNVTFPATGNYTIQYRVASPNSTGVISSDLNAGSIQLGTIAVPNTGGWQAWTTVQRTVTVNAGTYNVGTFMSAGGFNLNWIKIVGASCSPTPTPTPTPTPAPTPTGFSSIVTETQFNQMFPGRNGFYTYQGLVSAAGAIAGFASTGSDTVKKQEAAAFLANVSHETGGLVYIEEIDKSGNYCDASQSYGCPAGTGQYYGRGPLQLSWNFNYKAAGDWMGTNLLNSPGLVASDATISWKSAMWYWMTQNGPGTMTSHNAMVNSAGFGQTIRSINGSLECNGNNTAQMQDRVSKYQSFTSILGVPTGSNLTC